MPGPGRTASVAAAVLVAAGATALVASWLRPSSEEPVPTTAASPRILFDDFAYRGPAQLTEAGWEARPRAGATLGRGLVRLRASAAGSGEALLCHEAPSGQGTSAARVRFRDPAAEGAVEAFAVRGAFAFEYRTGPAPTLELVFPGGSSRSLHVEPGWHMLLAQVGGGTIVYYVDGTLVAERSAGGHGGAPLTFGVSLERSAQATHRLEVDWVFHQADAVLSPAAVVGGVASLRRVGIGSQDTLDASGGPARSPCAAVVATATTS